MIKASARAQNGQPAHIIGLSRENCERLLHGKPIAFPLSELTGDSGDTAVMIIVGGETEGDIIEELEKHGFQMPKPATDPTQVN